MIPNDAQLAKINALSHKQLSSYDVEVFKVMAIDDSITSYYTMVMSDLRQKFYIDLVEGKVGLLLVHDDNQLNVGRFFDAEIDGEELYAWVYIPKDANFENLKASDIISNIENGVYKAVSIGFTTSPHDYTCSICKNNYFSYECDHFAGSVYEGEKCIVEISNKSGEGRLLEISIVPAGAVENAEFVLVSDQNASLVGAYSVKGSCMGDAGVCYTGSNTKILAKKKQTSLKGEFQTKTGGSMDKFQETINELQDKLLKLTAENAELKTKLEFSSGKEEIEKLQKTVEELEAVKNSVMDENKELQSKYDMVAGQFDVVVSLMKEYGVKALGNDFNEEEFEKLSVEEKTEKFKSFVETFVETFKPGKTTSDDVKDEVTGNLNLYKIK